MNLFAEWLRRCRALFQRDRLDQHLREEAEAHIEMRAAELQNEGLSPVEALSRSRKEFGPLLRMTEDSRQAWQFQTVEGLTEDVRYGLRQLAKDPGFTAICLLSLALGIGASTAVFSVIWGVLLHPYPYSGADRMVTFRVASGAGQNGFSNYLLLNEHEFEALHQSDVLDAVIATDSWDMVATGKDWAEAVRTGKLSSNALEYFGVPAMFGRIFNKSNASERVAVLSHRYWQSHYGQDPGAVGQMLQLDRENYRIIGVMPPQFAWFRDDVYIPLRSTNDPDRTYIIDGRLKAGVSRKVAEDSLQATIASFAIASPKRFPPDVRLKVRGMNSAVEEKLGGTLKSLFGGVLLLLVIGCANVSILFLVRSVCRSGELAVRSAIGASRFRLVRQLLVEALLVGTGGCTLGVLVANVAVPGILRSMPQNSFPNEAAVEVNGYVLLFAVSVSFITAMLFGLWPALESSRIDLSQVMQASSKRVLGSSARSRFNGTLIAGQIALTVFLLAAAVESTRTFLRLYRTPLGYDPSHVLIVSLQLPDGTHMEIAERQHFFAQVRQSVSDVPGVKAVGLYPFGFPPRAEFMRKLELYDQPSLTAQTVFANSISPEFFEAAGIPLVDGRLWSDAETNRAGRVAIVNRTFAERYWNGQSALGRRVRMPDFKAVTKWMLAHPGSDDWLEVIGVVGDTPNHGLSEKPRPAIYVPYSLVLTDSFNLAIRTDGDPLDYANSARRAIQAVNASQPVNEIRTAEQILGDEGWAVEKFIATLFACFSVVAIALAAVGVYSVVAFATEMRRQELGIRAALGAQRLSLMLLILHSGARAVLAGLVGGIALCGVANATLQRWTQASLSDPALIISVSFGLLLIVVAASCIPAWRGACADPIRALRENSD
jgi:predicted permease